MARPHVVEEMNKNITASYLNKYGKCSTLYFYIKVAYFNRKKITIKKIFNAFKLKYQREKNRINSNASTKSNKIK